MMCVIFCQQSKNLEFLEKTFNCASTLITRSIITNQEKPIQVVNINPNKEIVKNVTTCKSELLKTLKEWYSQGKLLKNSEEQVSLSYALRAGIHLFDEYESIQDELSVTGAKKKKVKTKALYSNEIIVFSDFKNSEITEKQLNTLKESYTSRKLNFYVITPHKIKLGLNENSTYDDIVAAIESNTLGLPENLHQLIKETNSFVCNVQFASDLIEILKPQKPPQGWQVDLKVGSYISIPVTGYRITAPYLEPKWRHKRLLIEQLESTKLLKSDNGEGSNVGDAKRETEIKSETNEIDTSLVKSVYYAPDCSKQYLTHEEKLAHKPNTEKCLDLLFMMDRKEINLLHCSGAVSLLKPRYKNKKALESFRHLHAAMLKQEAVGVLRRCYYRRTVPKLFALVPHGEDTFQIFQLPFKDCIANPFHFMESRLGLFAEDEVEKLGVSDSEQQIVNNFLSKLTIDDTHYEEFLPPHLKYNPKLNFLHKAISEKVLNPDFDVLNDMDFSCLTDLESLRPEIIRYNDSESELLLNFEKTE